MIASKQAAMPSDVAAHYDQLDLYYREIWGEHVHHGYWKTGNESPEEAVLLLSHAIAELAGIKRGDQVCDVGCGYGGTSRLLVDNYDARVHGYTLSQKQFAYAQAQGSRDARLTFHCQDFLKNDLRGESFQAVISIECMEHMSDKPAFFREAFRILESGGRLVMAVWTPALDLSPWKEKHLIEPICREGRMPSLLNRDEIQAAVEQAGFRWEHASELGAKVKKTWLLCCQRLVQKLLREPSYRRFLFDAASKERIFALTLVRLLLAYETRAMEYWIFAARKP